MKARTQKAIDFYLWFKENMELHWSSSLMHIFNTAWINNGYYGCFIEIRVDKTYHKTTEGEILQELIDTLGVSPSDSGYFKILFCTRVTPDKSWEK
jgi:hypothetical protein